MIIKQIWTANTYRNFNYLIVCPQTGEALAIDPLDHKKCLNTAKENGWKITKIINTHEHFDHIGGNTKIIKTTGAKLFVHNHAASNIPDTDSFLNAGDIIHVGKSVRLEVLYTPGHTIGHICLLSQTNPPSLFCGDTLFNAGVGNCTGGGNPEMLYETLYQQLSKLPDKTLIYPGHEYIENNLKFTLFIEPNNVKAKQLLEETKNQDASKALITTMGLEKEINTFFRLNSPAVIQKIKETFPNLPKKLDKKTVFIKLRELRNHW